MMEIPMEGDAKGKTLTAAQIKKKQKQDKLLMEATIAKQQEKHAERKATVKEMMIQAKPKLLEDFPKEAYQEYNTAGFKGTTIKAQYVVERLNDVFGIDGWQFEVTHRERIDGDVLVHGALVIKNTETGGIAAIRQASGGATMFFTKPGPKDDPDTFVSRPRGSWGDKYKSAETDALTKAASHLGIGMDVFKGLVNPDGSRKTKNQVNTSAPKQTAGKFGSGRPRKQATTVQANTAVDDI